MRSLENVWGRIYASASVCTFDNGALKPYRKILLTSLLAVILLTSLLAVVLLTSLLLVVVVSLWIYRTGSRTVVSRCNKALGSESRSCVTRFPSNACTRDGNKDSSE